MATDINKLIEPSSSNMPYFTLTAHKTPEELVEATTRLLTVIKTQPKLLNAFRMEVEISDENVLLRVCLDTKSWYDVYLRTKPRDEAVMIARQYITDTRNKVSSEKDGPSIINLNLELEKEKAYTPCNKAAFHSINLCEYDHSEYVCKVKVPTLDSREECCNFYCATGLIFEKFPTEDYILLLRRETIRELILAPWPHRERDNHCDNTELLKQTEFWSFLLSQWKLLKFHTMAVNFGQWESAIARSKYTQTCHAHVHLLFNQEDWEIMKKDVKSNELLAKLNIRNYSGPDYLLKNCMELEREVLQLEEWRCMENSIETLIVSVDKLSKTTKDGFDSLAKTTKDGFDSLANVIASVDKSTKDLVNSINSLVSQIKEDKSKHSEN